MSEPTIDSIDARRTQFQAAFDEAQNAKDRNRQGQFATPTILAREIAKTTVAMFNGLPMRFFEPSVGTGAFYGALLSQVPASRVVSAIGIEVDSTLASKASEFWGGLGLRVVNSDFTHCDANAISPPPTLILANPPYVRHHHLAADAKQRLQQMIGREVGIEVSGLAGLYVYFLLLASHRLALGGLAAWLIPSEFMDVNYGHSVRQYLTSQVTLLRIHRFNPDDVQFDDALVSSAVVFLKRERSPQGHQVQFTYGGSLQEPAVAESVAVEHLRVATKWTRYPRRVDEAKTHHTRAGVVLLGDLFRVQRGVATGANEMFILPLAEAERRGISASHLRPVLPSPRCLKERILYRDRRGYPTLDNPLALIDCDIPESQLKARDPALWEYLHETRFDEFKGRYLLGKRTPWYRQEQREPAPFLCTYMGRGVDEARPFRFILNESDAIATNLYLMLQPRGDLGARLRSDESLRASVLEGLSQITAKDLRTAGRVYGGGLHKIEPRELMQVSADGLMRLAPQLREGVDGGAGLFD